MPKEAGHRIASNKDAIRQLMKMDANGQLDEIYKNSGNHGFDDEGNITNTMKAQGGDYSQMMIQENAKHGINTKLDPRILKSFAENPGRNPNEGRTFSADEIDEALFEMEQGTSKKQVVTEQRQYTSNNSGIDYNRIESIIESSVKKYVSAMTKKLLKEGVGGGDSTLRAMKFGNTFSFIDDKGDIYEATLVKKRNLKDLNG